MKWLRNWRWYAFLQGTYETIRWGASSGRTHDTDMEWNVCYDYGMNVGEAVNYMIGREP